MAVAGTVAPIFKDEYNSTVIYNFYNVVNHNNKMWICKVDGTTGIEPNESNSDYWYSAIDGADAASLGGQTSAEWQTKIDNIQTTSSGTLSQAGWYRVAEYKGGSSYSMLGYRANSCEIIIKRENTTNPSEHHEITLSATTGNIGFKSRLSKPSKQLLTKIRYTYDTTNYIAYIEVYYDSNTSNGCFFEICHPADIKGVWQAITPTLTEETIEGVTVTTIYDIPSNASPATTADLANYLPLSGGNVTGQTIGANNGLGIFYADSNGVNVITRNDASSNATQRMLLVLNSKYTSSVKDALKFTDRVNGVGTDYIVLHTGNSNAVSISETAPTGTSVLWYDTVNKVLKRYVDGAWQQ